MMLDLLKRFKKQAPITTKEKASSELGQVYSYRDFPKYNPDDLIGRKGPAIYKKMMLDEQVKAAVKFKRDAITSRSFTFVVDADIDEEKKQERIALYKHIIKEISGSFNDSLNGIMSALYNGVSFSEVILKPVFYNGATWQGIHKIKLKPYDSFCFDIDEYGEIEDFYQQDLSKKTTLNLKDFIHYIINPDIDEHYGQSDLREAYRAWFSKDIIIKFRNMWLERHAGGFRWAQTREGKSLNPNTTEYRSLQDVLKSVNVSTGAIIPSSVELKSDYPGNTDAFEKAIDKCDMQIARALLVPPLLGVSPQGDVGSYSQSGTQLEAFFWTLEAEVSRLEEALNEQLFKRIGLINYADDGYPKIKFKPLSQSKTIELVTKWAELAEKGVVELTESDEGYIRSLMDMPQRSEETKALSKEKTDSIVMLIEKINSGALSKELGRSMIVSLYSVSEDLVDGMLENIEESQEPEAEGVEQQGGNLPRQMDEPVQDQDSELDDQDSNNDEMEKKDKNHTNETVSGKSLISVTAFAKGKAIKRVNFAKIANDSNDLIESNKNAIGDIGAEIVEDLIIKAKEAEPSLADGTASALKALKVDSKKKRKLNSAAAGMLKDGFKAGSQEAEREIDMAMGAAFCKRADRDRLKFIADDYFQTLAFKISGDLSDEYVKTIESVILQGARADWSWDQTTDEIYRALASKGLITAAKAKEVLADALGVASPDARLATIVRTSTFDAINNARDAYFRDPALDGFVVAYEYSAILDGRTTPVCRHLDEGNAGNHSLEWYSSNSGYRPPNHYNCRSLLIPVTVNDLEEYEEGPEPTISPQQGFGG